MRRTLLRHTPVMIAGLACLLLAAPGLAAKIVQVRVGDHPTFTRVVFELDAPAGYRIEKSVDQGTKELIVTLEAASTPRSVRSGSPEVGLVAVQQGTDRTVAHIRLRAPNAGVKELILSNPPRIVIDLMREPSRIAAAKPAAAKSPAPPSPEAKLPERVASDAKAPGAKLAGTKAADAKPSAPVVAPKVVEPAPPIVAVKPVPEAKPAPIPVKPAVPSKTEIAAVKPAEAKPPAIAVKPPAEPAVAPKPNVKPSEPADLAKRESQMSPLAAAAKPEARPTPPPVAPKLDAKSEIPAAVVVAGETAPAPKPEMAPATPPELAKSAAPEATAPMPPAGSEPAAGEPALAPERIAKPPTPAAPERTAAAKPRASEPAAPFDFFGLELAQVAMLGGGVLLLVILVALLLRRRRLPNDLDVTALVDGDDESAGGITEGLDFGASNREAERTPMPPSAAPVRKSIASAPEASAAMGDGLFGDTDQDLFESSEKGEKKMSQDTLDLPVSRGQRPMPAPTMATSAGSAAGDSDVTRLLRELERRVAQLETRLDESNDARERLERQVAAQSEELRVQRAAIARTQRALRGLNRGEEEQATEPALRDPSRPA